MSTDQLHPPHDHAVSGPGSSEALQLGAMLVQRQLLSDAALQMAMEEQARTGQSLGRILIDNSLVTESDLVATLARQLGMEFVDLGDFVVDPTAVALVPDTLARRYSAIPIAWESGRLIVAMADPSNVFAIDDIRAITGRDVVAVVSTRASIEGALDRYNRMESQADDITAQVAGGGDEEDELTSVKEVNEDAPIVKLVNLLITRAVADRASDIHIEPTDHDVRIRYRIDGVLHEVMRSPKTVQGRMVSRLKIMADINIAERRIPQDGRISAVVGGRAIDLRVATLPTVNGEKVVMRILDKSTALLRLSDLGFLPANMARYQASFTKPYGTVLVTGPTGSGKSTTLYATLNLLNDESRNVITVEDPVEYMLPGINQVQVNAKAGLTFASALRSILRSDPDIVLVGEIRDRETATIAIEAALTGHLVLSTLHTNDAATTPSRLVEMGVEPFLVGSAIDCIVAQRLARRLCERCKEPYDPSDAELDSAGWEADGPEGEASFFRAVGCEACSRTGYHGRMGIHEVMSVTEEVERLICEHGQSDAIRRMALEQGMLTLRRSGLHQVAQGMTSIPEVLRVSC